MAAAIRDRNISVDAATIGCEPSSNTAFAGNTVTNGPSGLLSTSYTTVDTGAGITSLDPFISAVYAARAVGVKLTSWVMDPSVAEAVQKIKRAAGSNETLIDITANGGLSICGLPVHTLAAVDANTLFWGIPEARVVTVLRKDAEVTRIKGFRLLQRRARRASDHPRWYRVPTPGSRHPRLRRRLIDEGKGGPGVLVRTSRVLSPQLILVN